MNLGRLRLLTIVAPIGYILLVEVVSLFVLLPLTSGNAILRLLIIFGLLVVAVVPFSFSVFSIIERRMEDLAEANRQIERRNRQLAAVNVAIGAVSSALDLKDVLQNIADAARELVHSRYSALGALDESGRIIEFITSGITDAEREAIGPLPRGHGLIGALISEGKPLRIPDISRDPRSQGFPPNHPPMTSLLGVPILFHGRSVGDLYLTDKLGAADFSREDEELLVLLARHAAVAIANARLYGEVRSARDRLQDWSSELEAKVAERTAKIARYSKDLTKRVLQAQEEERKRIARELHDETAQSLSTLLITLDLLQQQVPDDNAALLAICERVRALARRTLDETRALSHDLRPTILDDVGLSAAIEWFVEEWKRTFQVPVRVRVDAVDDDRLAPEVEIALFRIAQEALNNAGKYAQATEVLVELRSSPEALTLTVEDNGTGFDPRHVRGPTREGGLGLYGIRERADLLGAQLTIRTTVGEGTCISVVAPLQDSVQVLTGAMSGEIES